MVQSAGATSATPRRELQEETADNDKSEHQKQPRVRDHCPPQASAISTKPCQKLGQNASQVSPMPEQ